MIAAPLLLILMAVALVRAGWGGDRRLSHGGWALGAGALLWLALLDGAWAVAVGATLGVAAAMALMLFIAATAPVRRSAGRTGASRPEKIAVATARSGVRADDLALRRRLAVFVLTVPVSFLAAQWFAFACNAAMKGDAPLEANSVATMFMAVPLVWAGLMSWQLCQRGPADMIRPPLLIAGLGALLWMFA
ncbi:hypothetical protein [Croceicoccus hydrothermalis]|uniref:hypothetical protein n=1 Tax=Croceicoccus hydrothermalis TaxID=2867964 RepID=UPI001EFA6E81|nr:hypothetical protein [Croceicoccus hydrothermalis]